MAKRSLLTHRREFLAAMSGAALTSTLSRFASSEEAQPLLLKAETSSVALSTGQPPTPIWSLQGPTPSSAPRFKRGSQLQIVLENDLPAPTVLYWRGLDGVPQAEPLATQAPLSPGAKATLTVPLRQAGTFLCDLRLLADGVGRPSRPLPFVVEEAENIPVDRDAVLLVEDFRLRADGNAVPPGGDPGDTTPIYTVNGQITPDIAVRSQERLRFRFLNGCQRLVIAIKIEGQDVWVMALDSQPAEPFLARNSAVVLAPGGRLDAFVDVSNPPGSTSKIYLHDGKAARPVANLVTSSEPAIRLAPGAPAPALPSNGLPSQLDLRNALRVELTLNGSEWTQPQQGFVLSAAPAFRAKRGRVVVIALTNRGDISTVFHLHGHHFRLLDRLDDGWKPYWLDTLAIEPGQTQRIAFAAEYSGHWLIESTAADWAAPRLLRWYIID